MSDDTQGRRRRRRRRRKAPTAIIPIAANDPAPPDPGPIEQPPFVPGVGQVYPEGDDDGVGPAPVGIAKGGTVTIALPARFMEILRWAAGMRRQPIEHLAAELLRGPLAGMKPAWRQARTGKLGGTVRKEDMAKVIGE